MKDYKDDVKKKVTRQVKIVKEDATPEEIDQVMKSAGGTGAMFKSAILKSANNEVVEAYSQAADQYQDVLRLEESMQELHQVSGSIVGTSHPLSGWALDAELGACSFYCVVKPTPSWFPAPLSLLSDVRRLCTAHGAAGRTA